MKTTIDVQKIQIARLKKGYSQRELSRISGVSSLTVNYLEQGKSVPRPNTLKKICAVLDLDITQICKVSYEQ